VEVRHRGDDELHRPGNPYSAWASERDALAVGPDPTTGLSKADLDDIEGFLRAMTFDAIHNGTRQG